ncbi:transcription repressor OFP7 [Brachypodium distachyon]|uniref:Transcription repressor n=1 Tax=Brachypodium distachyon TaxID=15368 RepID=I1H8K1_BRADI|nr:transcription repressor OFP7 [Brachypodium distachyon]KQK23106.1 hypothetical protein BRADI_1g71320v3 [Brachypodium distachyon]|eukprot:XP_003561945.1 transcription repressor OFP7 [Brachypodium distachyon]
MAKRLFHSCRSPSAAAVVTPTTTTHAHLGKRHQPPPPTGACCPRGLPRSRRPSLPPETCGARGCAADYAADDLPPARGSPAYRWLKSSHWHVIEAAAAAATDGDEDTPSPRLKIDARRRLRRSRRERRRRRLHRKTTALASLSLSLSSGDSGWFSSSDEDDEDEPASYSRRMVSTATETTTSSGASGSSAGAVLAAADEQRAVGVVAGSFAVVKRSDDPRADFRRSMADMVVGRRIYDADGLERLLRCFLALNDERHRRDIVGAFGDVWEAVFSDPHATATFSQPAS